MCPLGRIPDFPCQAPSKLTINTLSVCFFPPWMIHFQQLEKLSDLIGSHGRITSRWPWFLRLVQFLSTRIQVQIAILTSHGGRNQPRQGFIRWAKSVICFSFLFFTSHYIAFSSLPAMSIGVVAYSSLHVPIHLQWSIVNHWLFFIFSPGCASENVVGRKCSNQASDTSFSPASRTTGPHDRSMAVKPGDQVKPLGTVASNNLRDKKTKKQLLDDGIFLLNIGRSMGGLV